MFLDQKNIDQQYSADKVLWGNETPNKYLVNAVDLIPSNGKILDLGCGEGRNALYLAKKGFQVTAIDISAPAIEKLKMSADDIGKPIEIILGDIGKIPFSKSWDAIISIATLHLLEEQVQTSVIKNMKSSTAKGGINLITMFTKSDIGVQEYPELSFLDLQELKALYKDWEILIAENYTKNETHGGPHTHHLAVIVARKV